MYGTRCRQWWACMGLRRHRNYGSNFGRRTAFFLLVNFEEMDYLPRYLVWALTVLSQWKFRSTLTEL